ncbi:MAG: (4Fe-4S)-binding protein [Salibacteraceae bacterium]
MSASVTKKYTNGEVTVVWKPSTCIHSEKCWRGLPSVFNPKGKLWINLDDARTEDLIKQVDQCPSGVLLWHRNDEEKQLSKPDKTMSKIEIVPNGPIRLHGDVSITHSDGKEEKRERITAFCRCGLSSSKPFCDGTHKREQWQE